MRAFSIRTSAMVRFSRSAHPKLIDAMNGETHWDQQLQHHTKAINVNQPEVNEGLCRIAAKLALAIYYEERRKIACTNTLISTFWTHNQREQDGDIVTEVLKTFPGWRYLKQGKWDTGGSFYVRYLVEGTCVQMAAIFYELVALMAHFDDGAAYCEGHDWQFTFTPHPQGGLRIVSVGGDGGKTWSEFVWR